jgi:hypothetical protein
VSDAMNFNMGGETPESWTAEDVDSGKWSQEDHTEAGVAKDFLSQLQATYEGKELTNLANMLSTRIDDEGHALRDSRLFVRAAAKAARQFDAMLRNREGRRDDGQPQLKYNMPVDENQRRALQREAQAILERELMAARSEFIKRSGRSLPGWWK